MCVNISVSFFWGGPRYSSIQRNICDRIVPPIFLVTSRTDEGERKREMKREREMTR